jgi:hypothetical protein
MNRRLVPKGEPYARHSELRQTRKTCRRLPTYEYYREICNRTNETLNFPLSLVTVHCLIDAAARATAATNTLDAGTDMAKVQEWLGGHADITTTRVYDYPKTRPEDLPVFKVKY